MSVNRTLSNAQEIIELLADRGPLTPAEIAVATGVARSSVYRLVEGLSTVGLAELLPDSRCTLSNRWLHLADAVEPSMSEWANARRVLDDLADRTAQTLYLSVPRGQQAVCVAWAQGRGIDLLVLKPGRALPLYAGAAGRTILAHSPGLVADLLAQTPLPALTPRTLVTAKAVAADIETTLARGYTFSDEDVTLGIGAIGVPVFRSGEFAGCLSMAGLVQDIRALRKTLIPELQQAAEEIIDHPVDGTGPVDPPA